MVSTRSTSLAAVTSSCMSYIWVILNADFQENKHRIGLEFSRLVLICTAGPKKVENTSTLLSSRLRITGSNWNRQLVPKAHARVQFCSDPVRSHACFPEWKSALKWNIIYFHTENPHKRLTVGPNIITLDKFLEKKVIFNSPDGITSENFA